MILKRALTLLLVVVFSTAAFAQDYKTNVKQSFSRYYKHIIASEFDKSLDYLPPALFKIAPRAQILAALKDALNTPGFQIKMKDFEMKDVLDRKKIDTNYYVKIRYVARLTMKMNADSAESAEEKESRLSAIKDVFEDTFGAEYVSLDFPTETFTIAPPKTCWAISRDGLKDWKFMTAEREQRQFMEKILPKEIMEESFN